MRLIDKVCLVTGSANGIGLATAQRFASEGAHVVICDLQDEAVDAAVTAIAAAGGSARGYAVDVRHRTAVRDMIDDVVATTGRLDVLVNNAGITRDASLLKMTEEQFDAVIAVNLKGVFNCTQAAAEPMVAQGSGSIINTSSVSGVYGNFGQTNYSAAKSALLGMTRTLARELGPKGVRVNTVVPGPVATDMLENVPANVLERIREASWLKRLGTPAEIASVYLFLASDEASYVNGATLEVSGGVSL